MLKNANSPRHGLIALAAGCALSSLVVTGDVRALSPAQMEQSLAKITVLHDNQPVSRASGFAWKRKDWVVTSLHAMRKGASYQVERPGQSGTWAAVPIKHIADHDLVLLELRSVRDRSQAVPANKLPGWTPYDATAKVPAWNSEVYVVGYYLDTPKPRPISLKIARQSSPLKDLIPTSQAAQIRAGGIPNIDEDVVHFQGPLLPGYSGAPVVNASGQLVAVGDGGLESGAIDISWGIKAMHLPGLENAADGLPDVIASTTQHFSAGLDTTGRSNTIRYGPYEFVYSKTRSFAEMAQHSDNPADLEYQLSSMGGDKIDYSSFRYDIYQDLNYGLVIAVPAGSPLTINGGKLQADFGGYEIHYEAAAKPEKIQALLAEPDIHQALVQDFIRTKGFTPDSVDFDTHGSACDLSLEGGVLATLGFITPDSEGYSSDYMFSKVAIRGQLELKAEVLLGAMVQASESMFDMGACEVVPDCADIDPDSYCALRCRWLQAITSVHFTSFSNFQAAGEGCQLPDQPYFTATDPSRTTYGVIAQPDFDDYSLDMEDEGLYVSDLEIFVEDGQYLVASIHQDLPVPTYWLHEMEFDEFYAELGELSQIGFQLKDIELTWVGDTWEFSGVFQSDLRSTHYRSYETWEAMLADFNAQQEGGWNLIDLEVPYGSDRFYIGAVYQYNAGPSTYRYGNFETMKGIYQEMAASGYHMTDVETFWDGQTQWLAGIFAPSEKYSYVEVQEWAAFEEAAGVWQSKGLNLEDLEIFTGNDTRWAIGIFR